MRKQHAIPRLCLVAAALFAWVVSCGLAETDEGTGTAEPASSRETSVTPNTEPVPTVVERGKWPLWVDGPHLRGANVYQRRVYPELDGPELLGPGPFGPPYTQEDLNQLAALGANYVNLSHPGLFAKEPPYALDEAAQDNLDHLLEMIVRADMFVVVSFRTGPGRAEFSVCCFGDDWLGERYLNDEVWRDSAAQDAWVAMWRHTAQRYRDQPAVVGYDLMVEPNANEVWFDEWDPDTFHAEHSGTTYDWNQLHPRIGAAIREVDPYTPILVGGMAYSAVEWLPYLEPSDDPLTVYAVHQYAPVPFTHQEPGALGRLKLSYPGTFDADWDGEDDTVNRAWLAELLSTVTDYASTHQVLVAVNEFGVMRWEPGAAQFMDDQMGLFEELGYNYALWAWEPSWSPWVEEVNAFNARCGPSPRGCDEDAPGELLEVIQRHWTRNQVRPSNYDAASSIEEPAGEERSRLSEVAHWLYLIDVNLEPETVEQIASSAYDMVVLDYIPSERENTDYPMAEVVAQLHEARHPKLVLAYVDIGEAEDYRTYWQPGWRVGEPAWIAGDDPDGWEGNYPVAYWDEAWRDIWLGEDGMLDQIVKAGFDGVYLDWVEAYSDEHVVALAEREGVDPVEEMVRWVGDIAAFGRASRPGFLVIAQNAAELAERDDYLALIDAIAQEQVWFDGGADNEPPGDCPLPRSEADVDSEAYRNSLSRACRRVYDRYPDSTLHVNSEEYLYYLTLARDKGVPVFTVDYALERANVTWVYETSRGLGFVPFAGNRALDRYVAPVP